MEKQQYVLKDIYAIGMFSAFIRGNDHKAMSEQGAQKIVEILVFKPKETTRHHSGVVIFNFKQI